MSPDSAGAPAGFLVGQSRLADIDWAHANSFTAALPDAQAAIFKRGFRRTSDKTDLLGFSARERFRRDGIANQQAPKNNPNLRENYQECEASAKVRRLA